MSSSTCARSSGRGCRSRSSCTSQPNWVDGVPAPTTDELIASAVPSRLGVDGVAALPPAQHALVLAAHAWSHQPLGRLGNLIDVAVTLQRADESEVAALARRWGCWRMWRTTRAAIGAVLEGSGRSAAVALWARHLRGVREPTVFEWHVKGALAPALGTTRYAGAGGGREPSPGHGRPGRRRAVAVKAAAGRAGPAERRDRPLGAHPRAGRARSYNHGRN